LSEWHGRNWNVRVLYSIEGVATQILISTSEGDLLVDCGDGTLRDLLNLNYDFARLRGVAITHGHFDHIAGLWALWGFLRMIGQTSNLYIIMPESCIEVAKVANVFTNIYKSAMPFKIIFKSLSNERKIKIEKLQVQAFAVIHRGSTKTYGVGKRIPACGYSLCYGEQRIVISGDTGACRSLQMFAKGADLAILEATYKERASKKGNFHLSVKEAAEIGKTAKEFILIHRQFGI
jgi:ribonuclease BN (tRNA processing enzyme)